MSWLDGIPDAMDVSLSELREMLMDREAWLLRVMGSQSRTRLSDTHTTHTGAKESDATERLSWTEPQSVLPGNKVSGLREK